MAAPTLVSPKLEAGLELVGSLDGTAVQPFAAFWLWDPEVDEWQLVIGTDLVEHAGPSAALGTIQQILRMDSSPDVELREVLVVGRRDRRLDFLRGVPKSGRGAFSPPVHLQRATAGGQFVEDAWIYRNDLSGLVTPSVTVTNHSVLVEWQSDATHEVRVSLYKGDQLAGGPIAVQTTGRGLRLGKPAAKLFEKLEPATTYRVVLETDDDRREVAATTRP